MSGKVKITKYGKVKTGDRWSGYNQKTNTMALPILPGTQNLRSFHILDSAEEKAI